MLFDLTFCCARGITFILYSTMRYQISSLIRKSERISDLCDMVLSNYLTAMRIDADARLKIILKKELAPSRASGLASLLPPLIFSAQFILDDMLFHWSVVRRSILPASESFAAIRAFFVFYRSKEQIWHTHRFPQRDPQNFSTVYTIEYRGVSPTW